MRGLWGISALALSLGIASTAAAQTVDDQLNLLGMPPRSTFYGWMKDPDSARVSRKPEL